MTTEQVIEKLRDPGNEIPRAEFDEVVRRREEFVPLLIEEIKRATELGYDAPTDDLFSSFALYLLAQLREPQALEPIMEYFALDTDGGDLFADIITEDGGRILAAVGHKNPEALEAYAKREGISRWVRSATFKAIALQAVWGERSREEVRQFFLNLMRTDAFGNNVHPWTHLVDACILLHPGDMLDEIEQLYQKDLVSYGFIGDFDSVQEDAAKDPKGYLEDMRERNPPITDTANEVKGWLLFRKPEPLSRKKPPISHTASAGSGSPKATPAISTPVRKPAPAPAPVGRNDQCPCGSGKKYKKCCMPKG